MDREEAIKEFLRVNDLEEQLGRVAAFVASRQPNTVLVFWEEPGGGYGAITVPHSEALAFGLASKAYEVLVEDNSNVDVTESDTDLGEGD